jgi:hypothetical protein
MACYRESFTLFTLYCRHHHHHYLFYYYSYHYYSYYSSYSYSYSYYYSYSYFYSYYYCCCCCYCSVSIINDVRFHAHFCAHEYNWRSCPQILAVAVDEHLLKK